MSKSINIMYLIANADLYGSNNSLLHLLDELSFQFVNPIVVSNNKGAFSSVLQKRGIPNFQVKYFYSIYPRLKSWRDCALFFPSLCRTLVYNYLAKKYLKKLALNHEIDLIHTNVGPLHLGYQVAKNLNIPHVWHIREYQDLYFGWQPLFFNTTFIRKLSNPGNCPIAITRGLFDYYSMKDNATVIYNGVRKASCTRFNPIKEKHFLFVGRLEEGKGIRDLILAFIEFGKNEQEYKLLIAGDGPELFKAFLYKIAADAGMGDRIIFLGFRNDVDILMARAMMLIVPSVYEGFGNTTVEAMFNGCLIVGRASGGTKEILSAPGVGFLYEGHDDLVAILHRVAEKGIGDFIPMILEAQRRAVKLYSRERYANQVLGVYRSMTGAFRHLKCSNS